MAYVPSLCVGVICGSAAYFCLSRTSIDARSEAARELGGEGYERLGASEAYSKLVTIYNEVANITPHPHRGPELDHSTDKVQEHRLVGTAKERWNKIIFELPNKLFK